MLREVAFKSERFKSHVGIPSMPDNGLHELFHDPVAGHGITNMDLLFIIQSFVGVFSIVDSEDVNDALFLVDDIEQPELADAVSPSVRGVPVEFLDIVTPKGF